MKRTAKHTTETIASILAAILAAILTTAALAGCEARREGTSEPDPRTSTACKRCDWAHADGADKG